MRLPNELQIARNDINGDINEKYMLNTYDLPESPKARTRVLTTEPKQEDFN